VAIQEAVADGCAATMFMPGDLLLVEPGDVVSLAQASDDYAHPVGVMASEDGGTNALLIPSAMAFEPLLGEDSFAKHKEAVRSLGAELRALDLPNVAFDMDSLADFEWARDNVPDFNQSLYNWQMQWYKEIV
jgi:2-phospho-L-lactate guanylyltransferase (CobY/MobA/RfbA family)